MNKQPGTVAISEHKIETLAANCLRVLADSLAVLRENGLPADVCLRKVFRDNRKYGSRDRHFLTKALFAFYRWHGWLEKAFPADEDPRRMLLASFAAQGERPLTLKLWCKELNLDFEAVNAMFDIAAPEDRFRAFAATDFGFTNSDLLPQWMLDELAPNAKEKYLPSLQTRPPVWIRIQKDEDSVLREFTTHGITWTHSGRLPSAYKLATHAKVNLCLLNSYRNGCFELQDFASQRIGFATSASGNEHWWDACAGGGGKTLLLATLLHPSGTVTASDIREKKLEEAKIRVQRGGFQNVLYAKWNDALSQQFDGVLVDAPCSSSGRWRRNPEMRLVATKDWLDQLTETQFEILHNVSSAVRPGGHLVYGTCSVFSRENTGVTERFLAEHPEFEPAPFRVDDTEQYQIQTFPEDADCDGTFCARFRRKDTAQ